MGLLLGNAWCCGSNIHGERQIGDVVHYEEEQQNPIDAICPSGMPRVFLVRLLDRRMGLIAAVMDS